MRENNRAKIHALPHVLASWTGRDGKFRVGVTRKLPKHRLSSDQMVPKEVEGQETDVVVFVRPPSIQIVPQAEGHIGPQAWTARRRPCPGGFSVGHFNITAGTLGCWVRDKDGNDVLLSNNHVLANSNEAVDGDRILQPGPYDLEGSTTDPFNDIGRLQAYATINHGQSPGCTLPGVGRFFKPRGAVDQPTPNLIDAAIAKPWGTAVDPLIFEIGIPSGMRAPQVGEAVHKSGRTTEHTSDDKVESLDLTVQVSYGNFTALFAEQGMVIAEASPFSQPGDSGSAIIAESDTALVGLLFAGGELDSGEDVTIFNNVVHIQNILGVTL